MALSQDDPEGLGLLAAEILPAVRHAAVEERAVARLEQVAVAVVVECDLALEHVEELHLPGLDDDLLGREAARFRTERRDHRADLPLEEARAEDRPTLRGAVERHDRIVTLVRDDDAACRLAVEERRDRHTERGGDLAEGVERGREPPGLDLRDHARGKAGLLGELPLLQLALAPEAFDALAERRHATSSDVAPSWRPAIAAIARATNTRVTFLRYGCVKSVLSRGFAGPAARSATRAIRSRVSRWPTSAAAAFSAGRGSEAPAPSTMRASRTISPSIRRATATPSTGKSNEPRRRSLRYAERQPSAGGSRMSATTSSGRLARYSMPSSRYSAGSGTVRSPPAPMSRTRAPRAHSTGAVSEEDTAQQRELPGATRQMSPSFFMQKPIALRHS